MDAAAAAAPQVQRRYYSYDFDFSRIPIAWDQVSDEQLQEFVQAVNGSTKQDFAEDYVATQAQQQHDDTADTGALEQ